MFIVFKHTFISIQPVQHTCFYVLYCIINYNIDTIMGKMQKRVMLGLARCITPKAQTQNNTMFVMSQLKLKIVTCHGTLTDPTCLHIYQSVRWRELGLGMAIGTRVEWYHFIYVLIKNTRWISYIRCRYIIFPYLYHAGNFIARKVSNPIMLITQKIKTNK